MRHVSGMTCSNVKLSLKLYKNVELKLTEEYKEYFKKYNRIIKRKNLTFTIYNKRNSVHVTGARDCRKLDSVILELSFMTGLTQATVTGLLRIDNSTHHFNLKHEVNLKILEKSSLINFPCVKHIKFDPQRFPGVSVRTHDHGTAVIFANGKINLLGSKSYVSANKLLIIIMDLVYNTFTSEQ